MAKMTFTPMQQRAIDVGQKNILVSAAAGSGKTAVLTERVLKMLTATPPVPADSLIIVTFTVAASIEMRERIEKKLMDLLEDDPQNELLKHQQFLLSRAKISTIHALCSSLIREQFQQLGLPPKFRLAEQTEINNIKVELLEELLEQGYRTADPAFLALANTYTDRDDRLLSELILKVYDWILKYPFPTAQLARYHTFYDAKPLSETDWVQILREEWILPTLADAKRWLQEAKDLAMADDKLIKCYYPALEQDVDQLTILYNTLREGRWDDACHIASTLEKVNLKAARGVEDKELLERIKLLRGSALEQVKKIQETFLCIDSKAFLEDQVFLSQTLQTLFSVVTDYMNRVAEHKLALGILDYTDLEHFALQLLVEETEKGYQKTPLAVTLSEQYTELLIDECQDINYLQNLIFWALSKGEQTMNRQEAVPQSENLFMVGDVKQSIYRFRNAVPELFVAKKKQFAKGSEQEELISLGHNFRSRAEVTEPINFIFEAIMTERFGGIDYDDKEALVPAARYEPYDGAFAELHLVESKRKTKGKSTEEQDEEQPDAMDREMDYLIALIERMVQEGYQVQGPSGLRPCRYRDFCVLLRTKKGKIDRMIKRMQEAGLPSFAEADTGYFNAPEVFMMLQLLRVIDNPLQDIPLFGVLTSPMFLFTPDEVVEIRLQEPKRSLYFGVTALAETGDVKCMQFLRTLMLLRQQANQLTLEQMIQLIYDHTGFLSLMEMQQSGRQKRANLCLLLHYAAAYEQLGGQGIDGFLRYLDRSIARGEDFSGANVSSEQADVVRVMSIHGSKGLEFPICIVANLSKSFNEQDLSKEVVFDADDGVALHIRKPKTHQRYSNLALEYFKQKQRLASRSEELRVLYVAATRAKEKLILIGSTGKGRAQKIAKEVQNSNNLSQYASRCNNMLDWILAATCRVTGFAECYLEEPLSKTMTLPLRFFYHDDQAVGETTTEERVFTKQPDQAIVDCLQKRLSFCYPHQEMTVLPVKVTATQLAKQQQTAFEAIPKRTLKDRTVLDGAARGTALHTFMQYADFSGAVLDLSAEVTRLVDQNFLTEQQGRALNLKAIQNFLASPLYQRMKQAQKLHREYAFLYGVPAQVVEESLSSQYEKEVILMQGIADLVIEEEDGIVIVDYKTDRLSNVADFEERYSRQLQLYGQALPDYFQKPVKECLIYALHLGKSIAIPMA